MSLFHVMEGEVRESLILTQEQLDELASVFKSVTRSPHMLVALGMHYGPV